MTDTIKPYAAPVIHRLYTVVSYLNNEYFVLKVNPKNLKVMGVKDGRLQDGPKSIFAFVRDMNDEDFNLLNEHQKFSKATTTQVDTRPFGLGNHVVLKKGVKPVAGIPAETVFVVIGVNPKTINVVPDGGYGNGAQYIRFDPRALEIVKANNRQRTAN